MSPLEFTKAISFYDIKKIDQLFTNKIKTTYSSTKDFAVERNKEDISLFNEVAKYLRQRVKKHPIILSGHSEGSIKRLINVLKEHRLKCCKKNRKH